MAAFDLLVTPHRAGEVAGLQERRHRVPERLVLRHRHGEEHPTLDGDRGAQSEYQNDRVHERPAVLEEGDYAGIDRHFNSLLSLLTFAVQRVVVAQMPLKHLGIDRLEHLVEQGVHGPSDQVAQVRLFPRHDIEHLRQFLISRY